MVLNMAIHMVNAKIVIAFNNFGRVSSNFFEIFHSYNALCIKKTRAAGVDTPSYFSLR